MIVSQLRYDCVCILSSDTKMATSLTTGGSIFVETSKDNINFGYILILKDKRTVPECGSDDKSYVRDFV